MKKNNLNGKKISLSIVLTLFLILFSLSSLSAYSGLGDGSSENPYQITNCNQLQEMNSGLTSNYVLMNNVDCSDTVNWNSGAGFLPIGDYFNQFIGNLNGQGYKITNLYSRAGGYYVALIGYLGSSGSVSNVNMENVNIATAWTVGALVGINFGIIDRCSSTGIVNGIDRGTGGLVGMNGNDYGPTGPKIISNSYSTASVYGSYQLGGFAGMNYGTITNSYSVGSVNGNGNFGGLVGFINNPVGISVNSFWDMETSGMSTSKGGTGKTTSEMKTQSTFTDAGWDFDNIWQIDSNVNGGYPSLMSPIGHVCVENWIQQNTECDGTSYTIQYHDENNCGTTNDLPADNGEIVPCVIPCTESWIQENTECDGTSYTIEYHDENNCGTTNDLPADNGEIVPCTFCDFCTETCSPCGGGCTSTDLGSMYLDYDFISDPLMVGDITGWDTSCITGMSLMFARSNFNQDISGWDVSKVTNMNQMFMGSVFNQDISGWDVSKVEDMSSMFRANSFFNQPLNNWDTSSVTKMDQMFYRTPFNQDISGWDTSSVTTMGQMFAYSIFDQAIGSWDVTSVADMDGMFLEAKLSPDNYDALLNGWASQEVQSGITFDAGNSKYSSVGQVGHDILVNEYGWTILDGELTCDFCTETCSPCGGGCTATSLRLMYYGYDWNTDNSGVGEITGWNTSCITDMSYAFGESNFNQDISGWDTSSVTNMRRMFFGVSFDQNLGSWNISQVTEMNDMFQGGTILSVANYDATLNGWASQNVQQGVQFDAPACTYSSAGRVAHDILVGKYNWAIYDSGGEYEGLGAGTLVDPYQITNCDQLRQMNTVISAYYVLMNDIDCSDTINWNDGEGFIPVAKGVFGTGFSGSLDGKNHKIINLYINRPTTDSVGLFTRIKSPAVIKNVMFENVTIIGRNNVGSLIGGGNTIMGNIDNCSVSGSVTGESVVGGLIGYGGGREGGYPNINNCYSTANVIATSGYGGGLIGIKGGTLTNSYSIGNVSGLGTLGGLTATSSQTTNNCFWDIQTSGMSTSGTGVGKTTAEMKTLSTFMGWDLTNTWQMCSDVNNGYPSLRGFGAGVNCTEINLSAKIPISTCTELKNIFTTAPLNYVLTNDIDCGGVTYTSFITGNFTGTLDGQGYSINNLFIFTGSPSIFTQINGNVINLQIHNLSLTSNSASDSRILAGITLKNYGNIINVSIYNYSIGTYTGAGSYQYAAAGFVGTNYGLLQNVNFYGAFNTFGGSGSKCTCASGIACTNYGTIDKATFNGTFSATMYIGSGAGVISTNNNGNITNSNVIGTASCSYSSNLPAITFGGISTTNNGLIYNTTFSGNVTGGAGPRPLSLGGLVGNNNGRILLSQFIGRISGQAITGQSTSIGGLVITNNGNITLSRFIGNISSTGGTTGNIGGIAAGNSIGIINQSYSKGTIQWNPTIATGGWASGITTTDSGSGKILDSYNMMNVNCSGAGGTGRACAGIMGYIIKGTARNIYSTGLITGTNGAGKLGGLTGTAGGVGASASYWDTQTSGQPVNGFTGIGKTTSEMKTQSTYAGWDFNNIWQISPFFNNGYPELRGLPTNIITIYTDYTPDSEVDGSNVYPRHNIFVNTTGNGNYTIINLYNDAGLVMSVNATSYNFTNLSNGRYYFNATTTNIDYGMSGSSATRTINISLPICSFCTESCSPCGGGCIATDLTNMYNGYNFAKDTKHVGNITGWDTSCITSMSGLFAHSDFNQDISGWDTSNVVDMNSVFAYNGRFNQPIGLWNTSSVTTMSETFIAATAFNHSLNSWDVSHVTDMTNMLNTASSYNQPMNNWNTSSVITMYGMFSGGNTQFQQDIGMWNISSVIDMTYFLNTGNWQPAIYDAILNGWSSQNPQYGVVFDAGNSQYSSAGEFGRNVLIDNYGWDISDGGLACIESWIQENTECDGASYTIQYYDENDCGTTNDLPEDSGTLVECSLPTIEITDCIGLQNINNNLARNYVLMNDIDCTGINYTPMDFMGVFDGQGYTISNIYYSVIDYYKSAGVFSSSSGTIKNVNIDAISLTTADYAPNYGGFIGVNNGNITNCNVFSGILSGSSSSGGFVGVNNGLITNCSTQAIVRSADGEGGGFVGTNNGIIINSSTSGSLYSGFLRIDGGFVGSNSGNISNCYTTESISSTYGYRIAGFVHSNTGIINNSYSIASGGVLAGGFVYQNDGTIINSFSTGAIGHYVYPGASSGGFIAINTGSCDNSYWDTETSGQTLSACGTGLTTSEMKSQSTFTNAGWDFDNVWQMCANINEGYPSLKSFGLCPPINLDSDSDGLPDIIDPNPTNPDADGDGLCDGPIIVVGVCVGVEDANGNGIVDEGETNPSNGDSDSDGIGDAVDCSPLNPAINVKITYYQDLDGDSFGNVNVAIQECSMPVGYVADFNDCNDNDAAINPSAEEICDNVDNDCSALTADGSQESWYSQPTTCGLGICSGNQGELTCQGGKQVNTCNPLSGAVPESCDIQTGYDLLDNNCDGTVDLNCESYCDQDGDGYTTHFVCIIGALKLPGDCDDSNRNIHPGATEACDSIDNNCNGLIDDGLTFDIDNDGYSSIGSCDGTKNDCDDNNLNIHPNALEICNGIDDTCNGLIDEGFVDTDGDKIADCVDLDDDNDGVPDLNDACPLVDATGFDADHNGCIDSVSGLQQTINTLPNDVLSDTIKNSLVSKVDNALKSINKDNDIAAINMLNAFISQIQAQRGKKVSEEAADMLIAYANNVIIKIRLG